MTTVQLTSLIAIKRLEAAPASLYTEFGDDVDNENDVSMQRALTKHPVRTRAVVELRLATSLAMICGMSAGLMLGCQVDTKFVDVPASVCASGEIWAFQDKDNPRMNPGRSCVQCHAEENDPYQAPLYAFAGTVMAAEDEGDDCRGVGGLTVIITGADGAEVAIQGNSAGNFWLDPEIEVVMPYTARIVDHAGNERVKQTPVDNGDCASCHTQEGANGAAGRLIPPAAVSSVADSSVPE